MLRCLGVPKSWTPAAWPNLPYGMFKYSSMEYAVKQVPVLRGLFEELAAGIAAPRLTYRYEWLEPGQQFGHGQFHVDGTGDPSEIHRLITLRGTPTEGEDQQILTAGIAWEFDGPYRHRARPTQEGCDRLLVRISRTQLGFRNHWD